MERINTDVLVVGGGLAGLVAAITAKEKGLDVTLISKSKVGKSGNTLIANVNISTLLKEEADQSEEKYEQFYNDITKSGKGINDRRIVEEFVKGSTEIVEVLENWGINLKKDNDLLVQQRIPGHSEARTIYGDAPAISFLNRGLTIMLPLLKKVQEMGIKIIENSAVVKILTNKEQVCGAIAINTKEEKIMVLQTTQLILASGGGGNLYNQTNNTRDITGDSYGLAFDAGAELRDMEFVQFYPTMIYSPVKLAMTNTLFGDGAVLRNAHGERFMVNYDGAGDMATRDVMSRAIFSEIQAGRGIDGGIYMDCTGIDKDILLSKYQKYYQYLKKYGIDILKEYVVVSPGTHFFMGGIRITADCTTNIKGLLACGEAAGGLHGANRLGGNALAEAIVFGITAGNNVNSKKSLLQLPDFSIEPFRKGIILIKDLKKELRQIMWQYCSIIRDDQLLKLAHEKVTYLSKMSLEARIEDNKELVSFYELRSMLDTALLIIAGAKKRKESRGGHYRMDFPLEDNTNFKGSFISKKKEKGQIGLEFYPVQ